MQDRVVAEAKSGSKLIAGQLSKGVPTTPVHSGDEEEAQICKNHPFIFVGAVRFAKRAAAMFPTLQAKIRPYNLTCH